VCKLRQYATPPEVATCEMAFVRAVIVKDVVSHFEEGENAQAISHGLNLFLHATLAKEDEPEAVLEHYDNKRLIEVAPKVMQFYKKSVFPLTLLADVFAARLSVPGFPSVEIAPLFEEVAEEAKRLMTLSQSLREYRESVTRNQ
jgi:hypothetical protein